jgi:3-hydroxybutyryl-CoA dehydrogenase
MAIECVAVIGAGTMGSGIAQVLAQAGLAVLLTDTVPEQRTRGLERIRRATARLVEKGDLTVEAQGELIDRVSVVEDLTAISGAQLVIEAIVEQLPAKEQLLRDLDGLLPAETILASNTSSISITRLAAATARPDRVIGMHFINPAPVMRLVEVIRGLATSDEATVAVMSLAQRLGKTAVTVQDVPGFVLNRLLIPMINEAIYLLQQGVAGRDDIDSVMMLGANHPMGPLALADLVGLDTCLSIMEILHRDLGEDKYRPCPLLRTMVAAGYLGRKVGRGFYTYA